MPTSDKPFEDIFKWEEGSVVQSRDIHFTVQGWWLYTLENHELYIAHGCEQSHGGDRWRGADTNCVRCGEHPPEDFVTVATMMHDPTKEKVTRHGMPVWK